MVAAATVSDRLAQRFRLWDVDGNGVVERSDFEAEAERIITALDAQGTPQGDELRRSYLEMFDGLSRAAGTDRMTAEQFEKVAEKEIISKGDAGFSRVLGPTIQSIVQVLDTDSDGEVSRVEMQKWFMAIGLQEEEADAAFAELDTDGSGRLSTTELVDAVRDYHLGRNDIPLLGR
ncbi:EF-hand domain-containing protein [Allonocardiopsis opalescens]|uniref:Ca2+-binding EF-hand superfamily protein n=1 Tax=Allonocardiopsis opalescens TaxID=1144618 RepID=A0A2T0QEV5_9ACTN|nr:EF-hand domain-containing protein [Allonocardiopsis opalescens]PRY02381.1 Ca2+-binding EF-hand superfamily protein [Allonocardiopsis opalescens]